MLVPVDGTTPVPKDLYTPNSQLREPEDSIIPHAALYIAQLVFLLAPPFRSRREVFTFLILALCIWSQLTPHFTNDPGVAQPFTVAWSYYLATLEKFLFSDGGVPERSFWHVDKPAGEALSMYSFGLSKFRWATMLVLNQRGIRWNFQVKNIPAMRIFVGKGWSMRLRFAASRLYDFAFNIIMADLMFQLGMRILFTPDEFREPGAINSKYLTMQHPNFLWQAAKCFVFGALPYYMVSAQYALFSIIGVLLHLTVPADWPPLFGRLSEITTIREFWGKFWHQQLRRMLSSYTQWLVDRLGIRRGTNLSSYTQLWLSFLISGFFHARSQLNMPSPLNITASERCDGFFVFFVWQAAAITFEDFVQWCFRQLGGDGAKLQGFRTLVGYVWVFYVLAYTLPCVGDTFLRMRMGAESMLPFTVWGPLVEKYVPVPLLVINVR